MKSDYLQYKSIIHPKLNNLRLQNVRILSQANTNQVIEQKGMTFDQDFVYSFPLFSSLLKKEGIRIREWIAKIDWSSRKAFLLITIFAIHYPFLLPSFFMRDEKKWREYLKSWSKIMPFCSIYRICWKSESI